jgi:hypothetical protein
MKFFLEGGKFVVFESAEARGAGPKILEQHAIAFDRSMDMRDPSKECEGNTGTAGHTGHVDSEASKGSKSAALPQ